MRKIVSALLALCLLLTTLPLGTLSVGAVMSSDYTYTVENGEADCQHIYDNACDATCNVCGDTRVPAEHVASIDMVTFTNATDYPFKWVSGAYVSTNPAYKNSDPTATLTVTQSGLLTIRYSTLNATSYDKFLISHNGVNVLYVDNAISSSFSLTVDVGDIVSVTVLTSSGYLGLLDDRISFTVEPLLLEAADVEAMCEDVVCSVCNKVIKPALGHVYDNQCDTVCNRCGETRQGHNYTDHSDVSCNTCGYVRYTYTVSGGVATITDANDSISGEVVIPSTLGGYPVKSIGAEAFKNCVRITGVTIPKSITDIGNAAFQGCSNLENITLPFIGSSRTPSGEGQVFGYIFGYTKENSIDYANEMAAAYQYFDGKYYLYYIPFSIRTVTVTDVTTIPAGAFRGCEGLTSVTIPDNVTSIQECAFWGCASLEKMKIPDSVKSIGEYAFCECRELRSVTIPNGVTRIERYSFNCCTNLTSITIPDSVTSIGYHAFSRCLELRSIDIPDHVASIEHDVFQGCKNLTSITIPKSLTNVGESAFDGCDALSDVWYWGGKTDHQAISIDSENAAIIDAVWHYICLVKGNEHIYDTICDTTCNVCGATREDVHIFEWVIDKESTCNLIGTKHQVCTLCGAVCNEGTEIPATGQHTYTDGRDMFCNECGSNRYVYTVAYGMATITYMDTAISGDLVIPSTLGGYPVAAIGEEAFKNCNQLTSVVIPNSVKSIGRGAFYGCNSLGSITLPFVGSSRTATGAYDEVFGYIFGYGSKQENTAAPGVTQYYAGMGNYYYYYIPRSLKTVTLTDTTQIPSNAFCACSDLTAVTLPDSVTSIEGSAFSGCSRLTSITIPDSVTSIGGSAFSNCSGLTSITIPDGVTSIGSYMFYNCSSLTSITIPDSVTSIGDAAFLGCPLAEGVWYEGSEADKQSISIDTTNTPLTSAKWHYHACKSGEHQYSLTCSPVCYVCGCPRFAEHTYDHNQDADCNVCNFVRYYTYTVLNGEVTITGTKNTLYGHVAIPPTLVGYPVTTIAASAFAYNYNISSVAIPDSVTSMGEYAFRSCRSLTTITLGKGIQTIGQGAFYDSGKLVTVYYRGTEAQKANIPIVNSKYLLNATWYFNTCIGQVAHTYENGVCTGCGDANVQVHTHTFAWVIDKTATCKETGLRHEECTSCGVKRNENTVIPATSEHTYDYACDGVCNVCGDTRVVSHHFEWVVDHAPNCKENGSKHEECTVCHVTRSENTVIPADGTQHVYDGADDATCNVCGLGYSWYYTYVVDQGEATIIDVDERILEGDVVIPSTVGGYPVTAIGKEAFKNCTYVTSIVIPSSVTEIGESAFRKCLELTSFTVEADNAALCAVDGVLFSKDMTTLVCYPANKAGTSYTVPNTVTTIGVSAFRYASKLTSITIPNSVTTIEKEAFVSCTGLKTVAIPKSVTSIGEYAFSFCSGLTSITIPNSVVTIDEGAFYSCSNLTDVTLSSNLTSVAPYMFYLCTGLTEINVPYGVTSIGDYAFYECTSLKDVTIPSTVTSIGTRSFYLCNALSDVWYRGSEAAMQGITIGTYNTPLQNATWHADSCIGAQSHTYDDVNDGSCNVCGFGYSWCYTYIVHQGEAMIIDVDERLVEGDVVIPSKFAGYPVTAIAEEAFKNCVDITGITIPNSVTNLNGKAFRKCLALTCFTVPADHTAFCAVDGVLFSKDMATLVCYPANKAGASYTIPNTVKTIGVSAFRYASQLTSITIPNSVTTICKEAFVSCTALNGITIPNSVTSIGEYAFSFCSGLTSITVPNSVVALDEGAFYGCSSLTDVTLSSNLESIAPYTFYLCSGLTKIAIPNGIKSVGDYAFYDCANLASVTIPKSVEKIGTRAFYLCNALEDVWYLGSEEDKSAISIDTYNTIFINATWHYNGCPEHIYDNACDPTCNVCGEERSVMAHSFEWVIDQENSCGIDGFKHEVCTKCNTTRNENTVIPATGNHRYDNICDGACNVCGQTRTTPHQLVWVIDQESSCVSTGMKHEECKSCGAKRNENTVIPAIGAHTYDDNGDAICNVCGHVRYYSYVVSDGKVTITDVDPAISGAITVPSVLDGCPVTVIGESAFAGCNKITAIVLPDSVTTIAYCAFERCTSLTTIVIPNSVTSIGYGAFSGDSQLTAVTFGNSVNSIGDYAFYACSKLTSIVLPDSLTTIGLEAFGACTSLTSVTMGDNVTKLGNRAFAGCSALTAITLPNRLTSVGYAMFENCSALQTIIIPDSVTSIGYGAFSGCENLTTAIIGNGVTSIAGYAFSNCAKLTAVTLGSNVTTIVEGAFTNCDLYDVFYRGTEAQRAQITIGASNTTLKNATWHYESCIGTAEHTYTDACDETCNVCEATREDIHTFEWVIDKVADCRGDGTKHEACSVCGVTRNENTVIPSTGAHGYDNDFDMDCNGCGTSRATGKCGTNAYWRLENGVLTIGGSGRIASYSGFRHTPWAAYKDQITTVQIGNDIISIGSYAFAAMGSLHTVVFEEGSVLQALRSHVFHYCSNLKSVRLPDTVVDIDYSAFGYCPKLTYVYMPECAVTLYKGIFVESPNVVLDVVETYTAYNYAVKYGIAYTLHEPTVPTGLALPNETLLASGTCGEDVTWRYYYSGKLIIEGSGKMDSYSYLTKMPWYEFRNDVRSVWIDKDITEIGVYSLATLFNLNRVVFEEGSQLQTIRDHAFHYCSALKSITLPEGVVQLEYAALGYCLQIENIYLPDSATVIYNNALIGSNLENVVVSVAADSAAYRYMTKRGIKVEVR